MRGWSSAVRPPCGAPRAPPSGASAESSLRFRTDSTTRGRRRARRHPSHGSTVNQSAKPDLPSTRVITRSSQSESATLQAHSHSGEIVQHKGYTYKVGGGGSIWPHPLRKQVDLKADPRRHGRRSPSCQRRGRLEALRNPSGASPPRYRRNGNRQGATIDRRQMSVIAGGQLLRVIFACRR